MWKLVKILPTVVVASIFTASIFMVYSPSLAAPAALPNCGNDVVGGSQDSGFPDIAASNDANHTYTAIVWSEGTGGRGNIKLAYSQAITTARTWQLNTNTNGVIDSSGLATEPAIVFDPTTNNRVHIAWVRKVSVASDNGDVYYTRCTLGGACDTPKQVATSVTVRALERATPAIAVNSTGDPVVFYVEKSGIYRWLSYAYFNTTVNSNFLKFEGGGLPAGGANVFGGDNVSETAISLKAVGDVLHVANTEDAGSNEINEQISYRKMNIARAAMSGGPLATALAPLASRNFGPGRDTRDPDFPALAALSNGKVVLAWQLTWIPDPTKFYLAYSQSADAGVNWTPDAGTGIYRYWLSDSNATISATPSPNDRINGIDPQSGDKTIDIHPAVALHYDGSQVDNNLVIHLAWHQQSPLVVYNEGSYVDTTQRTDVMYSYKKGSSAWAGTPILSGTTGLTRTNVTDYYGYSEKSMDHTANISKLRPKILFGNFGAHHNRLQVVYGSLNNITSKIQVRYNGWELGDNFVTPLRTQQDSDCDTRKDSTELPVVPGCQTVFNIYVFGQPTNNANCDGKFLPNPPGDYVPDFLDSNSDGDFLADDVDSTPTEYSTAGGVFLPVVLKN
ncbi:MAG: hypothetical protein FOGNACKC_02365 [Anaerolineae bacterium]|nr:hypothetical protein [Anaerolineae bacterium]